MFSCRIEKRAIIGKRFKLAHPTGIIIGISRIGDDVVIWQHVTIGASGREEEKGRYPIIGNNVKIYTNAVVIGDIKIGDNAKVAALSLVNKDVPDGFTAAGIPAIIKK